MLNPGIYSLGDVQITAPLTAAAQDAVLGLDGMAGATLSLRLAYGSGGSSLAAVVQTSLDGGTTWIDVARADFATASRTAVFNLSGLTPKTTPLVPSALGSEGANDGVLGDRLRLVLTSVGTYAGSTVLSARAAVR